MTEPTPPALTDAARFQTDCAVGENLTQQLAAAKEEIAWKNAAHERFVKGSNDEIQFLRAQLSAREPSAPVVDEGMVERALTAWFNGNYSPWATSKMIGMRAALTAALTRTDTGGGE